MVLTLSADEFTGTEAIAAVQRFTSGEPRVRPAALHPTTRVLKIGGQAFISREAAETARESLVIENRGWGTMRKLAVGSAVLALAAVIGTGTAEAATAASPAGSL